MKKWAILLVLNLVYAETFLLEPKGIKFLKVTQNRQEKQTLNNIKTHNKNCYYKYELISKQTCYKPTGNIFVTFGKKTKRDYLLYAKKHQLKFIKESNTLYHTILYEVIKPNIEIITFVNSLNKIKEEENIRIEWIQPRVLR